MDGLKSRFDFRKIDGVWQRRSVHGGPWFTLSVDRVEPEAIHNSVDRGKRRVYLAARNVWAWT